jgi:peptide/nickel transport system permease protein
VTTVVASSGTGAIADSSGARMYLRSLARPDFIVGFIIVMFWTVCAFVPGLITSGDPTAIHPDGLTLLGEPVPPGTAGFILGTDPIGRDYFTRLIYGAQVALTMAVVPNAIALALATMVGVTAGIVGGRTEFLLMRVTETVMVLPGFLIAMAIIATFGPSTLVLVFTLVSFSWTYAARVVYGETLRLREMLYIDAARSVGAGRLRIAVTHIVPHLRPLLIVYFTMNASFMVLLEAGLGFLGFGIQPPTPSWGSMLADARDQFFYPWLVILPGICLASLCIGFYLVGQGLQEAGRPLSKAVRL